jgi:hypothetical protein
MTHTTETSGDCSLLRDDEPVPTVGASSPA